METLDWNDCRLHIHLPTEKQLISDELKGCRQRICGKIPANDRQNYFKRLQLGTR